MVSRAAGDMADFWVRYWQHAGSSLHEFVRLMRRKVLAMGVPPLVYNGLLALVLLALLFFVVRGTRGLVRLFLFLLLVVVAFVVFAPELWLPPPSSRL